MIPYAAAIRIRNDRKRGNQIWIIPFWLLAVLLLPFALLLLPLVLVVCLIGRINPFPILAVLWQLFIAMKGTHVEVDDPHFSVLVHIS